MSDSILYLFVDTNLFLQCRPLEELDWARWAAFQEIRLIVSNPVLREIDYHKNKGGGRAGKRARATTTILRQILSDGDVIVRPSDPLVVLCVEPQQQYSKDLEGQLNYEERDDQLIGTARAFAQRNQECDVRLLTHDTTPMFTARGVGLRADLISDEWLLPPESTQVEKELASLKAENARLKKAEPSISIRCVDQTGSQVEQYKHTYKFFDPLTDEQIRELMQRLRGYFPLATSFGPTEPRERLASRSMTLGLSIRDILDKKDVFTPATVDEIAKYREKAYPQWMEQCEQVLRRLHLILEKEAPLLEFCFHAKNDGTRPATDCLVTVETRGGFQVMPPPYKEDDDDDIGEPEPTKLSLPPHPPTGVWRTIEAHRNLGDISRRFHQIVERSSSLDRIWNPPIVTPAPFELPRPRDPNKFYYKPDRPSMPLGSFSLECVNWRHGNEEEDFIVEIHVEPDQHEVKGALLCRIQAGNLSKSVCKTIPVQVTFSRISAFESAQNMVEDLSRLQSLGH